MSALRQEEIYPGEIYPGEIIPYPYTKPPRRKKKNKKIGVQVKPKTKTKKKVEVKPDIYIREKIVCFFILSIFLLTSVGLLMNYEVNTSINHENHSISRQIDSLEKDLTSLKVEAESLYSLDRIESLATEEYGMIYPKTSEVNYISVDESKISEIETILKEANKSFEFEKTSFEKIRDSISSFVNNWILFT